MGLSGCGCVTGIRVLFRGIIRVSWLLDPYQYDGVVAVGLTIDIGVRLHCFYCAID